MSTVDTLDDVQLVQEPHDTLTHHILEHTNGCRELAVKVVQYIREHAKLLLQPEHFREAVAVFPYHGPTREAFGGFTHENIPTAVEHLDCVRRTAATRLEDGEK